MIPRSEHPKPQFKRDEWQSLNGEWQFEIDNSDSGIERKLYENSVKLKQNITVPFCPESKLSNVQYTDFMNAVWYKKEIDIPKTDKNIFLHFGAADYYTKVYINGVEVGQHTGGYTSFYFDITKYINIGKNTICVYCKDDTRSDMIPSGKQCRRYNSYGCYYTRTTGIWQSVWLEFVPKTYVESVKFIPNVDSASIGISANLINKADLKITVYFNNKPVGEKEIKNAFGLQTFSIDLTEKHLWEIGNGQLYDVEIQFGDDLIHSYFGLRNIAIDGKKFLLNGKSVFQRLVLDQGFYPDGIYTAPTDEALENDIKLSMACGFNGARLHEKIFEERFLYYCDKYGYIVWGEYPNWGLDDSKAEAIYSILPEWLEEIRRDFNHPSIVGWCPFNETTKRQNDNVISLVYTTTKSVDPTRPCIDTSGWYHTKKTDIYDTHDYTQDLKIFAEHYENLDDDVWAELYPNCDIPNRQKYSGEPFFVSEYGGIRWSDAKDGWGYGNSPKSEDEFISRFIGLAEILMKNKNILGFCYTQLTDVEQEQNGIYRYNRTPKFDVEIFKNTLSQKAAIEE